MLLLLSLRIRTGKRPKRLALHLNMPFVRRSVWIERIVRPSGHLTVVRRMDSFQVSLMRCNERSVNSTLRSVSGQQRSVRIERIVRPSGPLTVVRRMDSFQVSLMRCNERSVNSTLRSVSVLNDPYGWNLLNVPVTDRYNAGVLDKPPKMYPPIKNLLTYLFSTTYTLCLQGNVRRRNGKEKYRLA